MLRFVEFYDADRIGRLRNIRQRQNIQRLDPFLYNDDEFEQRYRFSKNGVRHILDLINGELQKHTNRNNPVPPELQLLIALRFYATGSFHMMDADLFGVHQTTVTRIVHKVSRILASLSGDYIKFPTIEQQAAQRLRFFQIDNFPNVIGLIDGTHIEIEKPSVPHSELYRNRKSYFSINVQLMMDADFKINDIVARWYGSAHDSRVFFNSRLYDKLEDMQNDSWILGDSGYQCLPFLLTPFLNPNNQPEERYNSAHKRTRNLIERGIGCWKRRFPVLKYVLRAKLDNCPAIIVACAVLHNIAIHLRENNDFPENNLELDNVNGNFDNNIRGNAVRRTVVQRYFL